MSGGSFGFRATFMASECGAELSEQVISLLRTCDELVL